MGILTLCCLFIARLCFAAVLAALVGCLTEGERAEPPSPRSPQCSQAAPERRVTWRGSSSCLMRLCEDSPGSNAAVPGGQGQEEIQTIPGKSRAMPALPIPEPHRSRGFSPASQGNSLAPSPLPVKFCTLPGPRVALAPHPSSGRHIRANPTGIHSSAASAPRLGLHPISLMLR